jgi:hypothetical protein
MGDMQVESVVTEEQPKVDERLIAAADAVVKALKDNTGKNVVINVATTATSLKEAKKDASRLKKELSARQKSDPGIGPVIVRVLDLGSNKFSITVKRGRPARKARTRVGKNGAVKKKATVVPAQNIATLPPPEAIKAFGMAGKKDVLNMIKAVVENPALAAMVDAQLKNMGLTKEQYIALLDEGLNKQ